MIMVMVLVCGFDLYLPVVPGPQTHYRRYDEFSRRAGTHGRGAGVQHGHPRAVPGRRPALDGSAEGTTTLFISFTGDHNMTFLNDNSSPRVITGARKWSSNCGPRFTNSIRLIHC